MMMITGSGIGVSFLNGIARLRRSGPKLAAEIFRQHGTLRQVIEMVVLGRLKNFVIGEI